MMRKGLSWREKERSTIEKANCWKVLDYMGEGDRALIGFLRLFLKNKTGFYN